MATQTPNHEQDSRRAKAQALALTILAVAREQRQSLAEAMPTTDAQWFRIWQRAKVYVPSNETKALAVSIVEHWAFVVAHHGAAYVESVGR
jgi:trehalose/maltose hydrolase-like predicted phosphorylase